MARADLLLSLVKAGVSGDTGAFRSTVEAIIAEEKGKQHRVLADQLDRAMRSANGKSSPRSNYVFENGHRGRECIAEIVPRIRLSDIVLSDWCRESVRQLVQEQHRASLLRSHGLNPRHRVLLVGPPGNGKTSLAEAIAEDLAVPFLVVRYESMIGSYLGETAGRLKRVFDYVRTTPCVLFFDEFDAVGKERGDMHETGEIKRVVTSLLMQVDELPAYTVVVAATNHSELLDRAVWRRFQLRLDLPAPKQKELAAYFNRFLLSEYDAKTSAITIAKRLGAISYAEAEEFTMDVRRRDVMTEKNFPVDKIIEEQLKMWGKRVKPSIPDNREWSLH